MQSTKDKETIEKEQERDRALYFIEEGDKDFSPKHNKMVVEKTIKKYEAMRKRRQKDYEDKLGERADAVATYLKSRTAEGNTPVEKYFGKRWMAYLRGQNIIKQLKAKLNGQVRTVHLPQDGA